MQPHLFNIPHFNGNLKKKSCTLRYQQVLLLAQRNCNPQIKDFHWVKFYVQTQVMVTCATTVQTSNKQLTIMGPGGETSMSCPASADCCLASGGTARWNSQRWYLQHTWIKAVRAIMAVVTTQCINSQLWLVPHWGTTTPQPQGLLCSHPEGVPSSLEALHTERYTAPQLVKEGTMWREFSYLSSNLHRQVGSFTCRKIGTWDRFFYFPTEGRHAEDF
jgi:hypothetical protein